MLTRFDWCTLTSALVWPLASAGGWPSLPCFSFPFRNCGCPALAFCARGVRCCRYHGGCHAQRTASHLWRSSPALYHLLLLPAITFSEHRAQSRPLPLDSGTDARALSVRGCGVCRYKNRGQTERSPVFRRVGLVNIRLSPVSPETENGLAVDFRSPERLFDNRR